MNAWIQHVQRHEFPDGAKEFAVTVIGAAQRLQVDYGDGNKETANLQGCGDKIIIYGEHRYKPGVYRAVILLQDQNRVVDRKFLMVTQN